MDSLRIMKLAFPLVAVLSFALGGPLVRTARSETISTTFVAGNSNNGEMFDIYANRKLRITGIQIALDITAPAGTPVDIYFKTGTHVGSENNAANWILNTTGVSAISTVAYTPTNVLNLTTPLTVNAGERWALYLRCSAEAHISYTNGSGTGLLTASDPNLLIFEGTGMHGLFSTATTNRIPNITITYSFEFNKPVISLFGPKTVRTTATRYSILGVASDDVGVASVTAKYREVRANGSSRHVTKVLAPKANGIFTLSVRPFLGRNNITFVATDTSGKISNAAKVAVIGK